MIKIFRGNPPYNFIGKCIIYTHKKNKQWIHWFEKIKGPSYGKEEMTDGEIYL